MKMDQIRTRVRGNATWKIDDVASGQDYAAEDPRLLRTTCL